MRARQRRSAMDEERPKIRWWTVVLAVFWAVSLALSGLTARRFDAMFGKLDTPLPSATRMIVGMPTLSRIGLTFVSAGALILKSRLLPRRKSDLIDRIALVVLFLAVMGVATALMRPLMGPSYGMS